MLGINVSQVLASIRKDGDETSEGWWGDDEAVPEAEEKGIWSVKVQAAGEEGFWALRNLQEIRMGRKSQEKMR